MNQEDLIHGYDMVYLAACGLHGCLPDHAIMDAMDLKKVYQMAEYHSLASITYFAVEHYLKSSDAANLKADSALLAKWKDARNKNIRRHILFDAEREKLLAFMEEHRIWYMPLKGILLKDYYPTFAMRQMADNDILFDGAHRHAVFDYMTQNGYTADDFDKSNHDIYLKEPIYNFEMHVSLFNVHSKRELRNYYRDVQARLHKDSQNEYGYHFRDEDFYIYITAHIYKHFTMCGCGIRSFLDVYVYLQKMQDQLDWDYIDAELSKLGMQTFEKDCKQLAEKLFGKDCESLKGVSDRLSDSEKKLLEGCFRAGTYGTEENRVTNKVSDYMGDVQTANGFSRLKYVWHRLFPDAEYYRDQVPFVYEHRILIPFYVVFRWIKPLIFYPRRIWREVKTLWKYKG